MNYPMPKDESPGRVSIQKRTPVQAIAGALGGVTGFALSEVLSNSDEPSSGSLTHSMGIWFLFVILGIGAGIIAGNAYLNQSPPANKTIGIAAGALIVGGYLSGFMAQSLYQSMSYDSPILARILGWGLAGALGGLAVGIAFLSAKRVQNGLIGGGIGGLIGGALFDPIANAVESAAPARFIAIVLIGTLMSVLIGLIDVARTEMWLEVVSGELRGRQFLLMETVNRIGSARSAEVTLLADRTIKELHMEISKNASGVSFRCIANEPVLLNGVSTMSGHLKDGDVVRIGNTEVRVGLRNASGSQPVGQTTPQPTSRPLANGGVRPSAASMNDPSYQGRDSNAPASPTTPAPRQRPRLPTKDQN